MGLTGREAPRYVLMALLITGFVLPMLAGIPRIRWYTDEHGYAYYDIYWREARSDKDTALLLHFGPPREHPWTRPGSAKLAAKQAPAEKQEEGDLAEMLATPDTGLGGLSEQMADKTKETIATRAGRDRTEEAPSGVIFDYSPNRNAYRLPEGVRKVPDGRFGPGLQFAGGGLRLHIGEKGERSTLDG